MGKLTAAESTRKFECVLPPLIEAEELALSQNSGRPVAEAHSSLSSPRTQVPTSDASIHLCIFKK